MQNPQFTAAQIIENRLPQHSSEEAEEESEFADFIF